MTQGDTQATTNTKADEWPERLCRYGSIGFMRAICLPKSWSTPRLRFLAHAAALSRALRRAGHCDASARHPRDGRRSNDRFLRANACRCHLQRIELDGEFCPQARIHVDSRRSSTIGLLRGRALCSEPICIELRKAYCLPAKSSSSVSPASSIVEAKTLRPSVRNWREVKGSLWRRVRGAPAP